MAEPLNLKNPSGHDQKKSNEEYSERGGTKTTDSTTTTTATPRFVNIIPRGKSQPTGRRVTPTSISDQNTILEKRLPNGDLYIGTFSIDTPHGSGKYLWRDGCMYEGDWKKGKASGKGKFSWPSGATFEGEFKSGRMEGTGTFIGSDGDTYKGSWSGDRKQGYGVKYYSNGDYYEGHWKRNLQDEQGRYLWSNGNEYTGEWRHGIIHGGGVLVWNNGNRKDGNWENGVPKGHGVFTWPDGSSYIGCWSNDNAFGKNMNRIRQILNGTFYPAHHSGKIENEGLKGYYSHILSSPTIMVVDEESVDGRKSSSVDDSGIIERAFPRICIWEPDGEAGDITCDIIDNSEASMLYRDGIKQFRRNPCCFSGAEVKKPGQMISKGHKHYDLMLNLQLGIRYCIQKEYLLLRDLKVGDFDPKEKFWTRFPSEGSDSTPPHQSVDFRWKDYCPVVFRYLRELFQVDPADYMSAICGNDSLRELSSPGKSGSLFYLTQDDRFVIKTVKKSEVKVLVKMLPSYYKHMCRYENSLVAKFYGVHCVKPVGGVKTRFIVMGNLFCSGYKIHRRFDLKGSSHGRTTDKLKGEIDETTTLKDLDLNYVFLLQTNWYQELIKQIHRDCEFLEAERIMDYSLLVGLHFRDDITGDKIGLSPFMLRTGKGDSYQNEKFMRGCRFLEAPLEDMERVLSGRKPLIRLGSNMPARVKRIARRSDFDQYGSGGFPSHGDENHKVVMYFGIIDVLQDYDISKKIEHVYKSLQVDSTSISAVDPKLYSKRFQDFVARIFVEDP